MRIDPAASSARDIYKLMISLILPRPIAWVGTVGADGVQNLAPFSYFMGVSSKPPALAISVARGPGGKLKDSARNILESGEFTVSIASVALASAVNQSSASLPSDQSEFEFASLKPVTGERVSAPYPAEAAASMECRLIHSHDLGSVHLLVGEVLLFHVAERVLGSDGAIDARALDPLARLGGSDYAGLGEIFALPRPG